MELNIKFNYLCPFADEDTTRMMVKETIAAYVRRCLISNFRISREDILNIDIIDYDVWDPCHNIVARIQLVDEFDIWENYIICAWSRNEDQDHCTNSSFQKDHPQRWRRWRKR